MTGMTSEELCEARKVAAFSLRQSVKADEYLDVAVFKAVRSACGLKAKSVADVLADLIDQPTCRNTQLKFGVFECSECGGRCEQIDGFPREIDFAFCPYCGAEIIDEDVH